MAIAAARHARGAVSPVLHFKWFCYERTGAEEAYLSPKWGSGDLQVNGYLDLNPTSPGGQDDTSDVMPWGSDGGAPGVRPLIC